MADPLLGCPHCGKPVGFTTAMAGQVVACPHCRGPFQMPDRPPAAPPRASRPDNGNLDFDGGSEGAHSRAELGSYRSAATLATAFAVVGSVCVLVGFGLVVQSVVVPVLRGTDDRPAAVAAGILWLLSSLVLAAATIVGLFLVRSCVLVGVDAARTLRALERDAAAPKPK
jgi:DNA-directed RNA polymerase subunit RPC12/RpoP